MLALQHSISVCCVCNIPMHSGGATKTLTAGELSVELCLLAMNI